MKKKNPVFRHLIVACLAFAIIGGSGAVYQQAHAVAPVVSLDGNPSIALEVNKKEKVLACKGPNVEAPVKSAPPQLEFTGDIGKEQAKAAALLHAGLSESQVSRLKVSRDRDDGRLEYAVEFKSGGLEYEYTIDAVSGAVLEHERDRDD